MRVKLSKEGFEELENKLNRLPNNVSVKAIQDGMKKAVEPLKQKMTQIVPVGNGGAERVSRKKRDNAYRRGGATRRDLRILTVQDDPSEFKTLIGVSKLRGKVGWRTHFIVSGIAGKYRAKVGARPFLDDALTATKTQIEDNVATEIEKAVDVAIRKEGL